MSENQEVLYNLKDKVATITINWPQRRNAPDKPVLSKDRMTRGRE